MENNKEQVESNLFRYTFSTKNKKVVFVCGHEDTDPNFDKYFKETVKYLHGK